MAIGSGPQQCSQITPQNVLHKQCNLTGTVTCKDKVQFWMIWSNKDQKEVCSLEGESCTTIRYSWFKRHFNIFGGNTLDKLECTCGEVSVYRRGEDGGPWVIGR